MPTWKEPAFDATAAPGPDSVSMMGKLKQIVFDCRQPASLARFWAAALDGYEVLPYDDAEVARLTELGLTPASDPCVIVVGAGPELCFQQVDVVEVPKKPVHLDIATTDRDGEVDRLLAIGASVKHRFAGHTWLLDPEGNDFCVTDRSERS